jgi:hypothetical protein
MTKKKTQQEFEKEITDLTNGDFNAIGEYINSYTKVRFKHKCGNEFELYPNDFTRNPRCNVCNPKKRTHEQFVKEINDILSRLQESCKGLDKGLSFIEVENRLFLVWTENETIGPHDDPDIIRKALRLKK